MAGNCAEVLGEDLAAARDRDRWLPAQCQKSVFSRGVPFAFHSRGASPRRPVFRPATYITLRGPNSKIRNAVVSALF